LKEVVHNAPKRERRQTLSISEEGRAKKEESPGTITNKGPAVTNMERYYAGEQVARDEWSVMGAGSRLGKEDFGGANEHTEKKTIISMDGKTSGRQGMILLTEPEGSGTLRRGKGSRLRWVRGPLSTTGRELTGLQDE